ncbi:MAG: zinc dependent phospholipase C family protein [Desulfuromonadales bacterium]|nr:zinc dependent phospholipase C family protein [Desulfuromonadales bacterium]
MAFNIVTILILLLLLPTEAFAWGIGVHLQLGSQILEQTALLPLSLQTILMNNPHDFLYGCISADITLGKKYTHHLRNCHSWRMGKKILDAADSDRQRACAYGYLAHLAADTVAHSYFVPFKMIRTFNTVMLKHTYWEVRVEACVEEKIWLLAREIAQKNFTVNDTMMRQVLSNTLFSFGTNKRLFNSLLLLNRLQQWQKMIRSLSTNSKWTLPEENLNEYLSLAGEAVFSVLSDPESPYLQADPTGARSLNAARILRKNLKTLWQSGKLTEAEIENYLNELRPKFRQGILRQKQILELLSDES